MLWGFTILVIIQTALWAYFIVNKKYRVLITTLVLGISIIVLFIIAYIKYIYFDPCEGSISPCMNETGLFFVILLWLLLISVVISFVVFIIHCFIIRNKNEQS